MASWCCDSGASVSTHLTAPSLMGKVKLQHAFSTLASSSLNRQGSVLTNSPRLVLHSNSPFCCHHLSLKGSQDKKKPMDETLFWLFWSWVYQLLMILTGAFCSPAHVYSFRLTDHCGTADNTPRFRGSSSGNDPQLTVFNDWQQAGEWILIKLHYKGLALVQLAPSWEVSFSVKCHSTHTIYTLWLVLNRTNHRNITVYLASSYALW